jgi:hypothetical protein
MLLIGPLLRALRLPTVPAIPDIDSKVKELAAVRALKLMNNHVSRWPWRSILEFFERTVAIDESQLSAADIGDQPPYKRNIVFWRPKRALFTEGITVRTHAASMPDLPFRI